MAGYDVTSFFTSMALKKTSAPSRSFTFGGSDYSSRVIKWPKFKRGWDDVQAKTLTLQLANEDQAMNFLRTDKTKLQGEALVGVGWREGEGYEKEVDGLAYIDSIDVGTTTSNAAVSLVFLPDGTKFYVIDSSGELWQHNCVTPWNLDTAFYAGDSEDLQFTNSSANSVTFSGDGTKMFVMVSGILDNLYEYDLAVAYEPATASAIQETLSFSFDIFLDTPRGHCWSPDGTRLYVVDNVTDNVAQINLSTGFDLTTASDSTYRFDTTTMDSTPANISISPDGTRLYVVGESGDEINQIDLSTAYDLNTASDPEVVYDPSAQTASVFGMTLSPDGAYLYILNTINDTIYRYAFTNNQTSESIDLFAGTVRGVKYEDGRCTLTIADKFEGLSNRQVGTPDEPAEYVGSNYLPSDIAWWAVTSFGGYDTTQTSSNSDIDYVDFQAWAAVFSGDGVFMRGRFDGQKCTEVLRKIARQTHSAIFIKNNRLSFHRFSLADAAVSSVGVENSRLSLEFNIADVINRQYVAGGYDQDSGHQFTISQQSTGSVNSFGLHENLIEDNALWFVDSSSALNLAQRSLLANAEPDDKLTIESNLGLVFRVIGETVAVTDPFFSIADSYRILQQDIDLNTGKITVQADRTQTVIPFTLDSSNLDGPHRLT